MPSQADAHENSLLLHSLLQSRKQWQTSVFAKYVPTCTKPQTPSKPILKQDDGTMPPHTTTESTPFVTSSHPTPSLSDQPTPTATLDPDATCVGVKQESVSIQDHPGKETEKHSISINTRHPTTESQTSHDVSDKVTPLGTATLVMGPHIFPCTQFFRVVYASLPPAKPVPKPLVSPKRESDSPQIPLYPPWYVPPWGGPGVKVVDATTTIHPSGPSITVSETIEQVQHVDKPISPNQDNNMAIDETQDTLEMESIKADSIPSQDAPSTQDTAPQKKRGRQKKTNESPQKRIHPAPSLSPHIATSSTRPIPNPPPRPPFPPSFYPVYSPIPGQTSIPIPMHMPPRPVTLQSTLNVYPRPIPGIATHPITSATHPITSATHPITPDAAHPPVSPIRPPPFPMAAPDGTMPGAFYPRPMPHAPGPMLLPPGSFTPLPFGGFNYYRPRPMMPLKPATVKPRPDDYSNRKDKKLKSRRDILFQFQDNPKDLFKLPKEVIIEKMTAMEPYDLSLACYLPGLDQTAKKTKLKPQQGFIIHLKHVSSDMLKSIQECVQDPLLALKGITSKMHKLPAIDNYPLDFNAGMSGPHELALAPVYKNTQKHAKKGKEGAPSRPIDGSLDASLSGKRKHSEGTGSSKPRKVAKSGDAGKKIPRKSSSANSSAGNTPSTTRSASPTSAQQGHKQCAYCGSKSTPMWRRGPGGAGTLCNACGVKWKHGKILVGESPCIPESPAKSPLSKDASVIELPLEEKSDSVIKAVSPIPDANQPVSMGVVEPTSSAPIQELTQPTTPCQSEIVPPPTTTCVVAKPLKKRYH